MTPTTESFSVRGRHGEWGGWRWLADRSVWFDGIRSRALAWSPPPELGLDVGILTARIAEAAMRGERWLVHPCVGVLLAGGNKPDAHARLAAWIAVNTPAPRSGALGHLNLDWDTWLWMGEGPVLASAGVQALGSFSALPDACDGLAIPDPWGDSLPDAALAGDIGEASWWVRQPLSEAAESELAGDIRSLMALQLLLTKTMPDVAHWIQDVTRVVVPLVRSEAQEFRSGSIAGVPGLVFVEITRKQLLILEALVHESAHLHFHLSEADQDFIVAGHADLYASPLRRDPRPLRGIFLAFHALLYMCAFYKDWEGNTGDMRAGEARAHLKLQRDAAAAVLCGARSNLTAAGEQFLRQCLDSADADDQR